MEQKFKVDFLYEALAIMHKMTLENDKDKDLYQNFCSYSNKDENLSGIFKRYFNFKEVIKKYVRPINDELKPYFGEFIYQTPFIINFYRFLQSQQSDNIKSVINEFFIDHLRELTNQTIDTLDLKNFLPLINSIDLKDHEKLMVINFYINGEEIYNSIINEAKIIEQVISKNYYLNKEDIDNFISYLQSIDLNAKLNEVLKFNMFKNDKYVITVSIFYYNQLFLNKENDYLYVYLGYLVYVLNDIKELNNYEDKRILSILKIISEPSRFKIIMLLKNREMYVREIAKEVGLTSATLVHHLEILLSENLIEIVENNNDKKRIFYKVNTSTINHFIKILGETLK